MRPKFKITANNEKQCDQVLRELSLSGDCATGWKMQFNADKCQTISGRGGRATYQRERTDYMEQSCSVLTRKGA